MPRQRLKNTVAAGDRVTLQIGDQSVLVQDVQILGAGSYAGTVYGFEPSFATSFGGISDGQRVEFDQKYVFWCSEN